MLQSRAVTSLAPPMQKNVSLICASLMFCTPPIFCIVFLHVVISLCLFLSQVAINHLLACQQIEGKDIALFFLEAPAYS